MIFICDVYFEKKREGKSKDKSPKILQNATLKTMRVAHMPYYAFERSA